MSGTQGRVHRKVRRALWTVNHEETTKTLQNQLNVMAAEDRTRWNFDFKKNIPLNGQYQWSIMGTGSNLLHDKLTIAPSGTSTSRLTDQTTCQERLLQDLNFSAVPEVDLRCNTTSSPHPAGAVGTKCPLCSTRPLEHPDRRSSDYPATDKENHRCSAHNSARKEHTNSGDVINRLSGCYSFTEVRVTGSKRQHPITGRSTRDVCALLCSIHTI